ncbi:MAG: hypothetical protein ND807_05750 [Vicinamibacterales bacterium]|nr:hypothetical protein [Vicinamibacterales bacterium]
MQISRRIATVVLLLAAGCRSAEPPQPAQVSRLKEAGAWKGVGNRTIGFVSETGVFRINWSTRSVAPTDAGTFRLTVRSAISGRPIRVVADQAGNGTGSVDFVDDPRMYEFIVDSAGIDWSFNAEE